MSIRGTRSETLGSTRGRIRSWRTLRARRGASLRRLTSRSTGTGSATTRGVSRRHSNRSKHGEVCSSTRLRRSHGRGLALRARSEAGGRGRAMGGPPSSSRATTGTAPGSRHGSTCATSIRPTSLGSHMAGRSRARRCQAAAIMEAATSLDLGHGKRRHPRLRSATCCSILPDPPRTQRPAELTPGRPSVPDRGDTHRGGSLLTADHGKPPDADDRDRVEPAPDARGEQRKKTS